MSTWREVAIALGHRMEHHAYCPEGIPEPGQITRNEIHEDPADYPDCPFCQDKLAYRLFRQKVEADRKRRASLT